MKLKCFWLIPAALGLAACDSNFAGSDIINPVPSDQQLAVPEGPLEAPTEVVMVEPTLSPIEDPFKTDPLLDGVSDVLADLQEETPPPPKEDSIECKEGEPYLYKGSLYCSNFFDE